MLQPESDSQYQADAQEINKQMPRSTRTTEILRGQKNTDITQNNHVNLNAECRNHPLFDHTHNKMYFVTTLLAM